MFGRTKDSQADSPATPAQAPAPAPAPGGKGRPTPRRREAELRNRRVVGSAAPSLPANATKAERKAAKQAARTAASAQRLQARQALVTGDEKGLPDRDRGPARRWARDYVDARLNPGDFFLPGAGVFMLASLFGRSVPIVAVAATLLLYGLVLLLIVDSVLLRRRVNRLVAAKFGAEAAKGTGTYAMTRALQFRKLRLPRAQVKRGQKIT